ncbi:hypothetical protein [Actinomadura sp. 9N407]
MTSARHRPEPRDLEGAPLIQSFWEYFLCSVTIEIIIAREPKDDFF